MGVWFLFSRDLLKNVKPESTVCWGWTQVTWLQTCGGSTMPFTSISLNHVSSSFGKFSSILTVGPHFLRCSFCLWSFGGRASWREKNWNVVSFSQKSRWERSEVSSLWPCFARTSRVSTKTYLESFFDAGLASGKMRLLYFLKEQKNIG